MSNDARSVTGKNIKYIMSLLNIHNPKYIHLPDVKPPYIDTPVVCEHRSTFICEIIDVRHQDMEILGFDYTILNFLCFSWYSYILFSF